MYEMENHWGIMILELKPSSILSEYNFFICTLKKDKKKTIGIAREREKERKKEGE